MLLRPPGLWLLLLLPCTQTRRVGQFLWFSDFHQLPQYDARVGPGRLLECGCRPAGEALRVPCPGTAEQNMTTGGASAFFETLRACVDTITSEGVNTCTQCALNSSKADIYTKPSRRYRSGARCVLVCRVLLGEPYRTVAPCQTIRKPPDDPLRHLSSVVALTLKASPIRGCVMYPEFVVFERAQCLPQYAIWYEHAAGCRCTHCAPPRFSG